MTDIDVAEPNPCAENPCPACGVRLRPPRVVDVNVALCRALGFDPAEVRRITIEVAPDDLPKVTVQHHGQNVVGDEFNNEISTKWHLTPIEDDGE